MKRSEAILRISGNMQKHENILRGYAKGSITLKCACDNLSIYILDELKKMGMLPPPDHIDWGVTERIMYTYYDHEPMEDYENPNKELLWEPEDEA